MRRRIARSGFAFAVIIGAGFMAAVVVAFTMLAVQEYRLASGVRESAVWSAFQLDREAGRFGLTLATPPSPSREAQVRRQFDLLYSKVDLLKSSSFARNFRTDPQLVRELGQTAGLVGEMAGILDASPKSLSDEAFAAVKALDGRVLSVTNDIAVRANELNGVGVADDRAAAIRLYWFLAACVGVLGVTGAAIIYVLIRQVSALDASRERLEAVSQELAAKAEEAVAGSRAKSQFLATMSHEIRTPMNGVIGAVELLSQTPLDGEQRELARTIASCGEALLGVINDVLDYSKLEAGKLEIETGAFDLRETVSRVAAMMRPKATEKRIEVTVEIDEAVPAQVMGDQGRIRQVLVNLVGNGLKFTSRGAVKIGVGYDAETSRLRFVVTDTGMGVPREALGGLFVEFNQLEASMARRFGGTGLGLAICKRLIDLMRGEIGVDSVVGVGSRFWFEVPAAPASAAAAQAPAPERETPPLDLLVADDVPVNRQLVGRMLTRMGHRVAFAVNGAEALSAVAAGRFDLVLMDLQMPEMDGFAAAAAIRALPGPAAAVPIAALTANASDEDRAACLAAGMNAFAAKPVSAAKLRALLADLFPAEAPAQPPAADARAEATRAALEAELGPEGIAELDAQFRADLAEFAQNLRRALEGREIGALRAVVHTLRGASANIGASALAQAADRVGDLCRREPFGPATQAEVLRLLAQISAFDAGGRPGAGGAPPRRQAA